MALTIEEDRITVRKQNSVQIKAVKILARKCGITLDRNISEEEKKKIQKEWDSVNKRTKTIPKNQGTKKDSEVHPKEAAEQEEKHISKKKSKDSGQMSLFDMMQPKES